METAARAGFGLVCLAVTVHFLAGGFPRAKRWVGYAITGTDIWPDASTTVAASGPPRGSVMA